MNIAVSERVGSSGLEHDPQEIIKKPTKITEVITRPQHKGILLPKKYLFAAYGETKQQYLGWREKQGYKERDNGNIDLVVGDDIKNSLVPVLVPHYTSLKESDFVIFHPNKPGVDRELIAKKYGGEVGLVNSDIFIKMTPYVDLEMVLSRVIRGAEEILKGDWKETYGGHAAAHFFEGSNFDVPDPLPLTKGGPFVIVMRILDGGNRLSQPAGDNYRGVILGATGVRFGVQQASWKGYSDPPPLFGQEKQAMLDLTYGIAAAFGSRVGTPL